MATNDKAVATINHASEVDLVTMYLINNLLFSLVDEMSLAVVRTTFSSLARDAFDFQCAVFKANGDLIMEGEGTILHSLAYCYIIRGLLAKYGADIHPGDVFLNNDPYHDASHLPDIYMLEPVFLEGALIAWTCSGGHMADIGGRVPGSCACDSTEIYQEGLRIPLVKFYENGKPNRSVVDMIQANSRLPETILGDLESHHAACHTGKNRLMELIQTYGWDTLEMYVDELMDYSERRTREEIRKLPDGEYEFTDYLDDDGFVDSLIAIKLKITVSGDSITYDFTGTAPQIKGSMNDPVGTTRAMILIGLRCMIDPEIPRNSGVWRPVKMIIPEGSLLNPNLPGACGGRGATLSRIMDVLMGAEAQIVPDRMPACESGADWLISMGTIDEEYGYTVLTECLWGGWGGRPFADGVNFCTPIFLDGGNQVCELNESMYPFKYKQYSYVPDTEGAGKFRGSYAVQKEWEFLGEEGTLQMRTERQRTQPWPLHGGSPGSFAKTILRRSNGEIYMMNKETVTIRKGDSVCVVTSGAGGWGNPLERDAEMVLDDVRNECVTVERAREAYGVVIAAGTMDVDRKATEKLRAERKVPVAAN
jgi:N-methylhydantoinase B